MPVRVLSLLTVALLGWGCATATRGSTEMLGIATVPPGASVSLSTGEQCTSPCEIEVKRRGPLSVTAALSGCESATVEVGSRIDRVGGWTLAGYGTLGLAGVLAESSKNEAKAFGHAIADVIVCVPVVAVGFDPEDCPRTEVRKEDEDPWKPLVAVGIPAMVDIVTGALNSRRPNPVVLELECGGGGSSAEEPQ